MEVEAEIQQTLFVLQEQIEPGDGEKIYNLFHFPPLLLLKFLLHGAPFSLLYPLSFFSS